MNLWMGDCRWCRAIVVKILASAPRVDRAAWGTLVRVDPRFINSELHLWPYVDRTCGTTISSAIYPRWEIERTLELGSTPIDLVVDLHRAAVHRWEDWDYDFDLTYKEFLSHLVQYLNALVRSFVPGINDFIDRDEIYDFEAEIGTLVKPPERSSPRQDLPYTWGRIIVQFSHDHWRHNLLRHRFITMVNLQLRMINSRCALLTFRIVPRGAGDLLVFTWARHEPVENSEQLRWVVPGYEIRGPPVGRRLDVYRSEDDNQPRDEHQSSQKEAPPLTGGDNISPDQDHPQQSPIDGEHIPPGHDEAEYEETMYSWIDFDAY